MAWYNWKKDHSLPVVVTDATSLNTWTFSGLSLKCSHNGTACSERPHTAKAQPKAQTPYLCCTNLYRVPTLLLFKQEDRDPFLMTITECNTLIACPWTGRHPAHHIPLVTRIPSALTAPAPTSRGSWRPHSLTPAATPAASQTLQSSTFTPAPPVSTMYLHSVVTDK